MATSATSRLALAAVVALSACASTPNALVRQGEQHKYNLTRAPGDAAECIVRNAESVGRLSARSERLLNGDAEVTVRDASGRDVAFFQITGADGNNEASAFIAHDPGRDMRGFSGSLVRGC